VRVKTEARRQAIMDVAAEAFRERGFDATSMSDVAARIGGSKATLYNYFCSKESLFAAVMMEAIREQARPIVETFAASDDIEAGVRRFMRDYIRFMLKPDTIAMNRMCVAEGERCGFGMQLYEAGPKLLFEKLARRIEKAMDAGEFRRADPERAACHLKGLADSGLVDRRLRGCCAQPTQAEIDAHAEAGAEAFLRAYRA
jgi:AcrR family transcriptional regulator